MTITIENRGPSLAESEIEAFERGERLVLPLDYRRFLEIYNGGLPSPDVVHITGARGSPTDIQVFFGLGRTVASSDLRWNRNAFAQRLGPKWLPIACDSGGNLFCLSISGHDAGQVFYIDLEQRPVAFHFVAKTFEALLVQLTTD